MKQITFDSQDAGVIIRATLTFTDFDPAGATAVLMYKGLVQAERRVPMAFDGVSVATYTIQDGDFSAGFYAAQVQVTNGPVSVSSETFQIQVTP